VLGLDVRDGQGQQGGGDESDRPKVETGGVGEHEAPCAVPEARTVGHVGFEVASALPDQVVAHVGSAVAGRVQFGGLGGAPPWAARRSSTAARTGATRGPYSRIRCRSRTT